MAAILAFIGRVGENQPTNAGLMYLGPTLLLVLFGLILSVVGFHIVVALSLGHQNYIMNIAVILYCWKKTEFYRDWEKHVHYKKWHQRFFEISIALFAVLTLYCILLTNQKLSEMFRKDSVLYIVLFISLWIVIFIIIERRYLQRKYGNEFKNRQKFIKDLYPANFEFHAKIDDPNNEARKVKELCECCKILSDYP
ncbi:MAG: hypothetical protein AYK19_12800 [Theionarchaea archaeon DG-70-1]|nr:MAG: hypothetical protein AYK19_12800 [Theionarchaea archaeon DG-70-1]